MNRWKETYETYQKEKVEKKRELTEKIVQYITTADYRLPIGGSYELHSEEEVTNKATSSCV
jgi:hypothetical protein